ncbi:hypothetical protein BHM03_00059944, partial [Ensete ventricosum]
PADTGSKASHGFLPSSPLPSFFRAEPPRSPLGSISPPAGPLPAGTTRAMAISHNDLSLRTHWRSDISSRLALFLVVISVLCGLVSFVLCLAAEASRSEVVVHVHHPTACSGWSINFFHNVRFMHGGAFLSYAGHMVPVEQQRRRQQDVPVRLHQQRADAAGLRRLRVPAARGRHVRRACLHAGGGHLPQAPGTGGLAVAPR